MNKQQLATLDDTLREGETFVDDYSPSLPPVGIDGYAPYAYALSFADGLFYLGLTVWSGYFYTPATQYMAPEEGWADAEETDMSSPFLSDLLSVLEDGVGRWMSQDWCPWLV